MHEEPTTSYMLGSFASFADLCADAFGFNGTSSCSWQYYPKNGSDVSEKITGADFALVIKCPGRKMRVAIFQAKREKSAKKGSFDVHQLKDNSGTESAIPQFVRFLSYATSIGSSAKGRAVSLEDIHWAHYLVYGATSMRCVSMSNLSQVAEFYERVKTEGKCRSPGMQYMDNQCSRNYLKLLSDGASTSLENGKSGWLEVNSENEKDAKATLLEYFDVHLAQQGMGFDPAPDEDMEELCASSDTNLAKSVAADPDALAQAGSDASAANTGTSPAQPDSSPRVSSGGPSKPRRM